MYVCPTCKAQFTIDPENRFIHKEVDYCCYHCELIASKEATSGSGIFYADKDSITYKSKLHRHLRQVGNERTASGYYARN